jgi:hypothetical protein
MPDDLTPQEQIEALHRLLAAARTENERMREHRGELEGQIVQIGAEAIRLRELLVQVMQEVQLADLSPALRHALERERENEVE